MKIYKMTKIIINKIVLVLCSQILIFLSFSASAEECPIFQAVLISTAGDEVDHASLEQSFIIPPGYETITGRLRFLSNEWPTYFGTIFNDTYLARLTTPGTVEILASGALNSSTWSASSLGYNGQTPIKSFIVDVSGQAGLTANLHYEVRDVGDSIIDSALAIDAISVKRTEQFVPAGGGNATGTTTISGQFGQAVRITIKNNSTIGTNVTVRDTSVFGEAKHSLIPSLGSVSFTFVSFREEPMGWDFLVTTEAQVFNVNYDIESTWAEGMPPNPCF